MATNGWDTVSQYLAGYGLDSLASDYKQWITEGLSEAEIYMRIRETQAYKTRFAANEQRRAAGLPELAESEIVKYEQEARQMFRAAGLPPGFYDQTEDFTRFLTNDISLAELQSRVNDGFLAVESAPPEVKSELSRLYGVNAGALAAYMLDPEKALPAIQRQVAAGRTSAAAVSTGYGGLTQSQAEDLARNGVSDQAARSGFAELASQKELFSNQGSESDATITPDEQLASQFKGNAFAQERINRKRGQRKSGFGTQAQFAGTNKGSSGLGSAESY